MKLSTYKTDMGISCGIITDRGIIDIPKNTGRPNKLYSIKQILMTGRDAFDQLRCIQEANPPLISLDSVVPVAPIPQPGKVLALAGNYKKHLEETAWQDRTFEEQATSTNPWPFLMPVSAMTGHNALVPWPVYSERVDYEIELAIFIGRRLHFADPETCQNAIGGYSIANDISARSVTFNEGRSDRSRDIFFDWLMGKWSDGFLPVGPYFVTADEIADPQNLDMELKVNGHIRQKANTSQMIFSISQIISFISHLMTLEPGDLIITGTPHGVGDADGRYLEPGDNIECTIECIGTLKNTLGSRPRRFYKGFIPQIV